MAELQYPYYRLQADGPDETGFTLLGHVEDGAAGPLTGQTAERTLQDLADRLRGDSGDVTVSLTRYDITTTYDL
ncbi:hypothetical protein [Streptomyces mirabilis]|uniref:hypothetical protein n=1 Tax=Streptomyces mirabilis TaxID=68239 RepID=UPI00324376F8